MDARVARWTALAGAGFVALILVGNGLSGDAAPVGYDPPAQLEYLRESAGTTRDTIALALELAGFALFPFFLARLWAQLRAADEGGAVLPMAVVVSGVTMLAVKLGSGPEIITLSDRADRLSADQVQQLLDVNSAAFVLSFLPFGVLLAAAGLAAVRNGGLPTWLGWAAVVLGIGNALASVTDPDAPMVIPFLLGLVWVVVASVVMARSAPALDDGPSTVMSRRLGTAR